MNITPLMTWWLATRTSAGRWLVDKGIRFGFWLDDENHKYADGIIEQCKEAKREGLSLYDWRVKHNSSRGDGLSKA